MREPRTKPKRKRFLVLCCGRLWFRRSLEAIGRKPDFLVSAVAVRLLGRTAATAQERFGRTIDGAAGPGDDLEWTGHHQRAIAQRFYRQRSAANLERRTVLREGFARCRELRRGVTAVAIRFALRSAATAERGPKHPRLGFDEEIGVEGKRTILADTNEVYDRRLLVRPVVPPLAGNCARGTR